MQQRRTRIFHTDLDLGRELLPKDGLIMRSIHIPLLDLYNV